MNSPVVMTHRRRALAVLLAVPAVLLAGCSGTPIEVAQNGNGSVTMTWNGQATAYNSGTGSGDTIQICTADATFCDPSSPDHLFTYFPENLSTEATLAVGVPVEASGGGTVPLPAGSYTLQVVWVDLAATPVYNDRGSLFGVTISSATGERPTWLQSFARASDDEACPRNWSASWAQWPNEGTGGYVCDRLMYADVNDEQVPLGPRAARGEPWLQSIPREADESPCPEGWTPSWAQWPNDGAGGPTCDRQG